MLQGDWTTTANLIRETVVEVAKVKQRACGDLYARWDSKDGETDCQIGEIKRWEVHEAG